MTGVRVRGWGRRLRFVVSIVDLAGSLLARGQILIFVIFKRPIQDITMLFVRRDTGKGRVGPGQVYD